MMKKPNSALSLLLAALLFLTSCSGADEKDAPAENKTNPAENNAAAENDNSADADGQNGQNGAEAAQEASEPTASDLIRARYKDTDLGGYVYRVMAPPPGGHFYQYGDNEIWADELNGEVVNDAIFNRNLSAEETLNIKIEPVWGGTDDSISAGIHTGVLAGGVDFDAALNNMNHMGVNMQNGDLLNLKNISAIHMEDPWWDKNIVDSFTMFGTKLYWISGDINIYDDYAVEVIYFNKQVCTDGGMDYPYGTVLEGKWTIDQFYEMAKTVERDVNGDGTLDPAEDVVGHCEQNDHIIHWIYALGEKSIDIAEDGTLMSRVGEDRHIRVIDTLYNYMVERQMSYTAGLGTLMGNRTLFAGNMLGMIGALRDMESEFGIIPMPKLDEEQENYGEFVSNGWCTAYGIPMTNEDPERTGVILDALCGFSTETLRSALYDTLFTAKYVRDEESVRMLDIIFASKMYDWAVGFPCGAVMDSIYTGIYKNRQNSFVSQTAKMQKIIDKNLKDLVDTVAALDY